jgi:membrane protein YqaA with SNARE-associated domain
MSLLAAAVVTTTFRNVLWQLGGPGLILLGVADNSVVPLPGSMDAFTIVLSASRKDLWWYYAIMATIGAVLGGYLTYRLGAKGGKETLEKKISKRRAEKVYHIFERYGFWSVSIGAVCPPPVPIVPFLIAAGALQYPRRKFLAALALGRAVRFTAVAYLGSIYGRRIFRWIALYYRPALYVLIGLAVIGGLAALYFWKRHRRRQDTKAQPSRSIRKLGFKKAS